jgi:hypothetical protein
MSRWAWYLLATLACGCGLELDEARILPAPVGAQRAVDAVRAVYGPPAMETPQIVWYAFSDDPGCPGVRAHGECLDGFTREHFLWMDGFTVVLWGDGMTFAGSSLAHELAHVRWRGVSPEHPVSIFGEDGYGGGVVGKAVQRLVKEGP